MGPITFYMRQTSALTVDTDTILLDLQATGNTHFTDNFTGSGTLVCTFTDVLTNVVTYGGGVVYSEEGVHLWD